MEIEPIACFEAPRTVVFEPGYRDRNALRGIDGFDHLWIIWAPADGEWPDSADAVGNGLALTTVALEGVEAIRGRGTVLRVGPSELPDGALVFDIKPYVAYTDAHE